jgi:ribonuclease R
MEELEVPTPPFPAGEAAGSGDVAAVLRRLSETLPKLSAREGRGKLAFPQLLLRSLKQARYDPQNLGHFGLSSTSYLHFTSPIRRYPDLLVHRALLHELGQGSGAEGPGELHDIAAHCSTMERVISKVELKADDIALAFLLDRRLFEGGWEQIFEGEIIGVIESGAFVHFGGSFEGYVPARNLPGEYYAQSEWGTALVGRRSGRRFRLGDPVNVRVERVDCLTGKVELSLAEAPPDDGAADETSSRQAGAVRAKRAPTTNRRRRTPAGAQPRGPR